jgi:acyl-CoA synthetase (AMP-forming)/AMP-acid ligase II
VTNVGSILSHAARVHGDRIGIRCGPLARTYEQIDARASAFASSLAAAGVQPGDRVVLLQHNGPALLETLFAVLKAGAVAVPVNARLHPLEYAYVIEHCDAAAVVFGPSFAAGLDSTGACRGRRAVVTADGLPWAAAMEDWIRSGNPAFADVERTPDDLAWLFYTSGTTGRPKGAMITHGNLRFMCDQYPSEVRQVSPGEVCLHVAPLTHAGGLWALALTEAGAQHLLTETASFDPDAVLALVERSRAAQVVFMAPTMLTMLLDTPGIDRYDTSSLQLVGYGGSPAYSSELQRAVARFGPVFCQIYGQGECPMTITMLAPEEHAEGRPRRAEVLTSAGKRREGIEVAVLGPDDAVLPAGAVGEVGVRGPVVMRGYWRDDDATSAAFANGWYHTGDIGRFDDDGYLYLLDRVKDLIITGGSNVYGREVEDVLLLHPGVVEAAVIGVPDRVWGEVVTALVVGRDGRAPAVADLEALCAERLAGYKKPRRWEFVGSLPKNGYGKVLKRELRAARAATP